MCPLCDERWQWLRARTVAKRDECATSLEDCSTAASTRRLDGTPALRAAVAATARRVTIEAERRTAVGLISRIHSQCISARTRI